MAVKQTLVTGELTAVDNTQAAFRSVQRSAANTARSAAALNQQFRFLRGGAGQLGHQIQDIAVQLSMGTNAMIVFGQQGSQIASLFGPKGAMIGAFAAVAAAIGVVFLRDTKKASKELETFGEKAIQAAKDVGILTQTSRDFLTILARDNVNKAANELQKYKQRLAESSEALAQHKRDLIAVNGGTTTLEQSIRLQSKTAGEVNAQIAEQTRQSTLLAGQVEILTREHSEAVEVLRALREQANPYEDLVENAQTATAQLQETIALREAREQAEMDLRLARLKQLTNLNNAEMQALIDKDKAQKDLADQARARELQDFELRQARTDNIIANANRELDAIVEAEKKKQAALEATKAVMEASISIIGQQTTQLMSMLDQQSGAYKALFVVQQATQVAQAIMSAHTAANNAMALIPGPAGVVLGNVILGLGYANAAAIAGQTIASFEGGGMIPDGPRAGGVDGRGGRMAIVHPNEKITDMRKGGDNPQPVNVSFNIQANDARGFDEMLVKRRALIVNMVNQAINNRGRRSLT